MSFTLFLTLFAAALIGGASESIDTIKCGRVFEKIPGPFSYKNEYIDASGTRWSAGGFGSISVSSPGKGSRLFQLSRTAQFRSIFVADDQFILAAGSTGDLPGTKGIIYTSKDRGETWAEQKIIIDAGLNAVTCVDHLTCWAVGDEGTVLRTTDGGEVWTASATGIKESLLAVDFVSANTGWIVGRSGSVLKTEDGGATWKTQEGVTRSKGSRAGRDRVDWGGLSFRDADTGCIAGLNRIACTSDGGESWDRTFFDDQEDTYNFVSFAFSKNRIRALEECGDDFESSDDGRTWREIKQKKSKPVSVRDKAIFRGRIFRLDLRVGYSYLSESLAGEPQVSPVGRRTI